MTAMQTGAVFPGKIGRSKLLKTHDFSSALVPGQTYRFSGSSDLSSGQTQEPDSASSDLQQTHEPESVSSELVSGRDQRPAGSGSSDLALGQQQDTVSHTSADSSTTNWVVNLNNSVFMSGDEITDDEITDFPNLDPCAKLVPRAPGGGELHPAILRHVNGTCEPCVFHGATRGCRHGDHCSYCHLNHAPPVVDRRVRKRTRDKITARLQTLLRPPVDLDAVHAELQKEAVHHIFGRAMIHDYLEDPDPENFFNARLQTQ